MLPQQRCLDPLKPVLPIGVHDGIFYILMILLGRRNIYSEAAPVYWPLEISRDFLEDGL